MVNLFINNLNVRNFAERKNIVKTSDMLYEDQWKRVKIERWIFA